MQRRDFWFVIKGFLLWRVAITIIVMFAIKYVPLSGINFFGGKYINYITNPIVWSWANFDGEHYLSIAMFGYKDLQQAFFPAYPIIVNLVAKIFGSDISSYLWAGIISSNLLFLGSLIIFWKLVKMDYSNKIANISTILLLIFPTSFYFGAVYTESLFLFTSLLTYYLYRNNKFLFAGIVGFIMTLTRIYGLFILAMIAIDIVCKKDFVTKFIKDKMYFLGISIAGIFSYMWYLWKNYSDPFAFYSLQTLVGEQRSNHLVFLPQVFYRYIVKIIPSLSWDMFPIVFTTLLEFFVAILFLFIIIFSFKKIRLDYWIYMILGYLAPTLTGSFSSLPRYIVVLFPAFIFIASKFLNVNKYLRLGIYIFMIITAVITEMLFSRGYFVS